MYLKISDIQPGDVLLCYSNLTSDEDTALGTGYSHSAISLDGVRILEASTSGVKITTTDNLFDDCDHIAVLRELTKNSVWDTERLGYLEDFASQAIGKRFNQLGLGKFFSRKESYQNDLMGRVEDYFDGIASEISSNRGVYFCSELIVAAFIHVGIIEQSAAQVFTPETFSPSDIAKDKAFGFFYGYIKSRPDYVVPEGDFFRFSV